jgi:phage-related protein
MATAGLNLIKGLFNGISNAVGWLYGMLRGWVSNVISYIKGLFGIHSPSRVFATVGDFLV